MLQGSLERREPDESPLSRFLDRSSFWMPEFLTGSAWMEHAPFAFWLVGQLRPTSFVELGTHAGYSYLAVCQAVQLHDTGTRCHAIDTWLGDEHAGFYGEEVYDRLAAYNQEHYAGFSTLIRSSFDDALGGFEDGSVDLLHIDGRHFYQDVRHDFESWRPKLSNRAVVLFHDTHERERDFGVLRYFDELAASHPTFRFPHGHGLGVLKVGDVPSSVGGLFTIDERGAEDVRRAYERLGSALTDSLQRDQLAREVTQRSAQRDRLRTEVHVMRSSRSWRMTRPLRALGMRLRQLPHP